MPPPPAEPFASRIFLGPALRTQPDRRLVKLVREGYEAAFEEIVRRYRKPLDRFAAAFVGNRAEDVTQDAFSKALLALRGSEREIELRPWLYRIVRNTALNDLRDGPPATEELSETVSSGPSAAIEAERREEIAELMERLRALPEPQRAAIVMRELEGLSHEEIAAALGVSGGAARQTIHRARLALRDGMGLLIPLPLLRLLFEHGAEAAGAGGAVAAAGAATAAGGSGATLGGVGAAGALKVGLATAVLAGSVGAGVAVQNDHGGSGRGGPEPAEAAALTDAGGGGSASSGLKTSGSGSPLGSGADGRGGRGSEDDSSHGGKGSDDDHRGHGDRGAEAEDERDDSGHSGGSGSGNSGPGSGRGSGHGGRDSGGGEDRPDSGGDLSAGSHSGHSGSGGSGGNSGSGEEAEPASSPPPAPEPEPDDDGDSSGSGSGDSGSGGSGGGFDDDS